MATKLGVPDFNFNSPKQVMDILFNRIGLTPVTTTDGKPWTWLLDQPDDVADETNPSTNKQALLLLQDKHPFVRTLSDARKINHICKTWLVKPYDPTAEDEKGMYDPALHDEMSKGGGILSKIWPDGKLHSHFSQLKETARFSSSRLNLQNQPKKAEGDIIRIFGGVDKAPPSIKTIYIPERKDWVFMEADFSQAEMFVTAGLSGDQNMMGALTVPGRDLHDETALRSFNITVTYVDGKPVDNVDLLTLAAKDKKAFKKLQETLLYVDARGIVMSRALFKNSYRVSAKNIFNGTVIR